MYNNIWPSIPVIQPFSVRRGLLRLGPFKELPSHFHPEPYGEIYHFLRGNGQARGPQKLGWVCGDLGVKFMWETTNTKMNHM